MIHAFLNEWGCRWNGAICGSSWRLRARAHLAPAARKLGQTQPTMGRRLRALEQALGQTLFQRTADGFVLTDEGTAVLAHAERIEEEALALQRQLDGHGDSTSTARLRLSSSDWFGTLMLTPVFADFAKLPSEVSSNF